MDENIKTYKAAVEKYYQGLKHFYPKFFNSNFEGFITPIKPFVYGGAKITRGQFIEEIIEFTGAKDDLAFAINKIIELHQLSDQELARTVPQNLKGLQVEAEKRSAEIKKTQIENKQVVETAIKKQQEIYDAKIARAREVESKLDKKLFVKVERVKAEATQEVNVLEEQAQANGPETARQVERILRSRVGKEIPKEYLDADIKQASLSITENLQGSTQTAVITSLARNHEIIDQVIPDKALADKLKGLTDALYTQKRSATELGKIIARNGFSGKFTAEVFDGYKYKVEFSTTPKEGFTEFDLGEIPRQSIETFGRQRSFLDLKGFGEAEIRSQLYSKASIWLDSQIAKLPANSALAKVYSSKLVQASLSSFGMGTPVDWVATNSFGRLAMSTGLGPTFGWLGELTGTGFGVTAVASSVQTAATATMVAETGGIMASEAFLGGAGAAAAGAGAGATVGVAGGPAAIVTVPLFAAIGAAVGKFAGKLISKIQTFLRENKLTELAPAVLMTGLVALPFGLGAGLGAGGVTFGGLKLWNSTPAGRASFGRGVGEFSRVLGAVALASVGKPILITLLVFPVVVAFILFIINSGAYVVPPRPPESAFTGIGVPVVCSDEKGPIGVAGPGSSSPIANRAWKITYDLYQGFWCFWNRSPGNPPHPDFPNDILTYPPGYPELFDYSLFKTNPNPSRSGVQNLFWCTWLPIKAYTENGSKIGANIYTPDMYADFERRGKIIDKTQATPSNVKPGAVVFFDVANSLNRLDHVGVIYAVNQDGVAFVQSNAATKDDFIPFGTSGLQDLPGIEVAHIGNP